MIYQLFLFAHILSAILAIGPFFVLLPIVKKLKSAEANEIGAFLGIFKSAIRLIKHAGHVLIISGVLLIYNSAWSWDESWIVMTLIVMFSSIFFLASAFSPTLRKFNDSECDHQLLVKKLHRSIWIYIGLLLIILWFMVAKPHLW